MSLSLPSNESKVDLPSPPWKELRGGPVVVFRWANAPGWPVEYVSPNVQSMFGVTPEDLISGRVSYASLVHPDDLKRISHEVGEAVRLKLEHFEQAYFFVRACGTIRHLYDYTVILRNDAGAVTHFEGYVLDDTERQTAQDSLREEEEDSRNLVAIAEVLAGDLTFSNLCFHALESLKQYAFLQRASLYLQRGSKPYLVDVIASVHPSSALGNRTSIDLRSDQWNRAVWASSIPLVVPDIAQEPLCDNSVLTGANTRSVIVIPMSLAEGRHAYLALGNHVESQAVRDTPRLRRFLQRLGVLLATALDRVNTLIQRESMEEQLHQAHKMEAVGLLAGGVAHNFNNTLTVILGYTSMLLAEDKFEEPVRSRLQAVLKAGESSAAAVRQLLEFSRKQKAHDPQAVDVGQVLASLEMMLRPLIGESLQLSVTTEPGLGCVFLEPGELEMVLMNLAVNAKDAVHGKGHLQFRASSVVEAVDGHNEFLVVLEVEDDGDGMSEEVRRRLFEPFFTTKDERHGTGLGLAAVYGVVQRAGGTIEIESEVGHGTLFRLKLPQLLANEKPENHAASPFSGPQGSGSILLVEDQSAVRCLAAEGLRAHGYEVFVACDGEEALALLADTSSTVDLLLSDVVMPRMDGLELCKRFSALRPDVPLLLMSGFVDRVFPEAPPEAQGIPFLRKPFTTAQLLEAVAQALQHS
jgi:PAS domain S-box-containing protein